MRRRVLLAATAVATLSTERVYAQQKAMPLIGYLSVGSPVTRADYVEAFLQELRENGFIHGRNISIEYRWAGSDVDRFSALAAELVALNADVIVTAGGTRAAVAAKYATGVIPIVFVAVGDPVEEGLVVSLARPGGNITGQSFFTPQLIAKRLELLKQAVPEARLIAVLLKPDASADQINRARLKEAELSAQSLGVRLHVVAARVPEDFDRAFAQISAARADALMVIATPLFIVERQRIADLAAKSGLPTISEFKEFATAGGLMSYGPNIDHLNRRAADYVIKILKGAKPADLPVEQPAKLDLIINLKTAKSLRLTIPPPMLARADEIIE